MEDRLQKILSAAGLCSRRQAEVYIQQGRVTVNGRPAALGDKADPQKTPLPWMANRRCSPPPGRC